MKVDQSFFGDAVEEWNTIWSEKTTALETLRQVAEDTADQ